MEEGLIDGERFYEIYEVYCAKWEEEGGADIFLGGRGISCACVVVCLFVWLCVCFVCLVKKKGGMDIFFLWAAGNRAKEVFLHV